MTKTLMEEEGRVDELTVDSQTAEELKAGADRGDDDDGDDEDDAEKHLHETKQRDKRIETITTTNTSLQVTLC